MKKYFNWDLSQLLLAFGFALFVFLAAGYYWVEAYPSPFNSICAANGYCTKK